MEIWEPHERHSHGYSWYRQLQFVFLRVGFATVIVVIFSLFLLVLTLEGHLSSGFEWCFGGFFWSHCSAYFLSTEIHVVESAIAYALKFEKTPGPSETEGRCFILGDRRSTWFAERQVCVLSVSLFV